MIDYENIRLVVAKGLKDYCNCPVIRSNQNEKPPSYPYISYTITTLMSANNGTYGEYEDGAERKPFNMTMSVSAVSNDNTESVTLTCKAREWLDRVGRTYLNDNNVIVQSVGSVTNRDNFLTVEYEYKNGFDVVFWLYDTIEGTANQEEYIEVADLGGINIKQPPTTEELVNKLAQRLDGEVV